MHIIASLLTVIVAALHIGFAYLEMVLWTGPVGLRTFGMTPEHAEMTAILAANQGVYNLFLAGGLLWGVIAEEGRGFALKVFFLTCVILAGIMGAVSAKFTILYTQAAPAALALLCVLLARK